MYSRKHLEKEAFETKKNLMKAGKVKEAAEIKIPVKVPRDPLSFSGPADNVPDDNVIIMRYMDFQKFKYLIEKSVLYMSAPKCFAQDLNEGFCIKSVRNYLDNFCEEVYIALQSYLATRPYVQTDPILCTGNKDADLERMRQNWFKIYKHNKKRYFISCWTERAIEQDNMWRSYIPNSETRERALVIKTTVGKLKAALKHNFGMFTITRVKYVDLDKFTPDDIPSFIQGVYPLNCYMIKLKDVCYEDDHEIRVITDNLMSNTTQWYKGGVMGLFGAADFDYGAEPDSYTFEAPLDLEGFIDEIIVSPTAQDGFIDEVKDFLKNHDLGNVLVSASRVNKKREM